MWRVRQFVLTPAAVAKVAARKPSVASTSSIRASSSDGFDDPAGNDDLPDPTKRMIAAARDAGVSVKVKIFDVETPTAKAAADELGVDLAQITNSLVKYGDGSGRPCGSCLALHRGNKERTLLSDQNLNTLAFVFWLLHAEHRHRSRILLLDGLPSQQVFEIKGPKSEPRKPVLVCAPGDRRVDLGKLAAALGVSKSKIKSASAETVLRVSGFQAGGVGPCGFLEPPFRAFVEVRCFDHADLWCGAGVKAGMLRIASADILAVTGGERADLAVDD